MDLFFPLLKLEQKEVVGREVPTTSDLKQAATSRLRSARFD